MGYLKLHEPCDAEADALDFEDSPRILPFPLRTDRFQPRPALLRARLLRENRNCPHCQHPVVTPLELEDGLLGRNRLPVPGTATLVGFHCMRCHREWPV